MKRLNRNIRALDASLQKRPKILKSVCVNRTLDIFDRMINNLVNVFIKATIRAQIVGEQFRALLYVFSYRFVDDVLATASNDFALYLAPAVAMPFEQSHNGDLAHKAGHGSNLLGSLVLVHESGRATNEGFIGFDRFTRPAQLLKGSRLHRQSDSVHKEPCGLLSYAKRAMNFIRAYPVLRRADHPDSGHPLVEADGRIFHERAQFDRKHLLALFVLALPRPARRYERDSIALTTRTGDLAVWPSKANHKVERVIRIVEVYDCFLKRFREGRCFRFHDA